MLAVQQKPFILIDGSSYLYRAFHALPPLTNTKGEPTGAIYGMVSMLRKLMVDYQPEAMAIIFDAKGKTFRSDLFAAYKSHRPPMPPELQSQIAPIHEIVTAMGIPLLCIEGVEADDVIGTLVQKTTSPVLVVTSDKDMAQLVNAQIQLINTMSGTLLDIAGVKKKFGVPPELIIDYLALVGDTSDNIPGIPNVGPKTAAKWLLHYGSLAAIMEHADKITGKVGDNLRASLAHLPLSRQLATIITEVPLKVTLQDLRLTAIDPNKLSAIFQRYEFKSWVNELSSQQPAKNLTENLTANKPLVDYQIIFTESEFFVWLTKLQQAALFAFDTETTSINYMVAELVGLSFAVKVGEAAYIPLVHDYPDAPQQLSKAWVLDQLKPLLEDETKLKVGQHLKYDKNVLANYHINLQGIAYDTMLESYVLNSTASRHNMDALALKHLNYQTIKFADLAGKGAKQLTFNQIDITKAGIYAAEDADIVLQLHQVFWPQIQASPGLAKLFSEIEMPLVPILARIEQAGVLVDVVMLQNQSQELAKRLTELQNEAYALAGEEFNLASPKQLQLILYEKMKLPILQKTPTGQASTSEDILQELALSYPFPKLILEHRSLSKLKSTYTDRLPEQIDSQTGRIHTSYHQAVTATGRLSSSDPNLQNIPIRNAEGRRIRKAFIAAPGCKLIAADYSQVELRIMAHLSQDPGLLAAFAQNLDVHKATAAEVFNVTFETVTLDQRRKAKAINFGLIYGMSSFGLAQQLGISRHEAQVYIDAYFARYPGVKNYMEDTRHKAHEKGYVETLSGRRLYLPEINARNQQQQRAAERAAINAPLQGTAADIIKLAMIKVFDELQKQKLAAQMIMQVHDELIFEVTDKDVNKVSELVRQVMSHSMKLDVPLIVDIGIGANWDDAH